FCLRRYIRLCLRPSLSHRYASALLRRYIRASQGQQPKQDAGAPLSPQLTRVVAGLSSLHLISLEPTSVSTRQLRFSLSEQILKGEAAQERRGPAMSGIRVVSSGRSFPPPPVHRGLDGIFDELPQPWRRGSAATLLGSASRDR